MGCRSYAENRLTNITGSGVNATYVYDGDLLHLAGSGTVRPARQGHGGQHHHRLHLALWRHPTPGAALMPGIWGRAAPKQGGAGVRPRSLIPCDPLAASPSPPTQAARR